MKKKTLSVLVIALLGIGTLAHAGSKTVLPVNVQTFSTGQSKASGSLGSARNSSDNSQFIGCVITTYETGSASVLCSAREADGTYGACTTTASALVQAARSIGNEGYVTFWWNTATGKCTEIIVDLYSDTEPKQ